MDSFALLNIAAAGMDAQRNALDVSARNIAAAEAAGPTGSFDREIPHFKQILDGQNEPLTVFSGATRDRGHSADAITEMVEVLNANRAFEANASVFETGKQIMLRTIDMGRV